MKLTMKGFLATFLSLCLNLGAVALFFMPIPESNAKNTNLNE